MSLRSLQTLPHLFPFLHLRSVHLREGAEDRARVEPRRLIPAIFSRRRRRRDLNDSTNTTRRAPPKRIAHKRRARDTPGLCECAFGFARVAPVDVFGMGGEDLPRATGLGPERLGVLGDLGRSELHGQLARRRVYLHPVRWTSLGLSLLEAMHLGMPVVALATTEAARAVPPEAGVVSADVAALQRAAARLLADPEEAAHRGAAARRHALRHYGLGRFLADWDALLGRCAPAAQPAATVGPAGRS